MEAVATIRAMARYPVKSMRREELNATSLTLQGLPEDRRYAFVQAASRSAFPWLTGRELQAMLRYRPYVDQGPPPRVWVVTPQEETLAVESEELRRGLETRSGRPLFLLRDHRGNYDAAAVSLISAQTTTRIAEESGTSPEPWRFRPNLLVELNDHRAFGEIDWVGRILRVGDHARVAVTEPDKRCVMITFDPATSAARPEVLRCVARQHRGVAGVYGTVLTPGDIRVGDPIFVEG